MTHQSNSDAPAQTTIDHQGRPMTYWGGKEADEDTYKEIRRECDEKLAAFAAGNESLRRQVAELQGELQHQTYAYGIEFERAEKSETEYEKLQQATVYELQGYTEAARSVIAQKAENAALLDWESRCAIALGVPGCSPEEMLNVIDSQREDAERYRWFRSKRLWDADQFPWPKDFEYPEPCLWDDGEMLDAAIDAARKA